MIKTAIVNSSHRDWLITDACYKMLSEEVGRPELYCRPQIESLVDAAILTQTLIVAEKDGEPIGVIGGFLVPNIYNPNIKVLSELLWYVKEEYRKGRAGYLLLKAFDKLASEIADEATMSTLLHSEVKIETLEKVGFKLKEFAFHKEY